MAVERDAERDRGSVSDRSAQFRYGVVFLLVLGLAVFVIAAPSANWSRAVALAIEGTALVVAVATSRERKEIRYRNAVIVGVAMIVLVVLVATGAVPRGFIEAANAVVTAAIPVVIVRGVLRLLRERGVTVHAVAGARDLHRGRSRVRVDHRLHHPRQLDPVLRAAHRRHGRRPGLLQLHRAVDHWLRRLSAATPAGHALAVIEMLTGQLYLVTVIGILIGNFVSRRAPT